MIDVLHVITSLDVGGAERLLVSVVEGTDRRQFRHRVLCLGQLGPLGQDLVDSGFDVEALRLRTGRPSPQRLRAACAAVRSTRPSLVHTWMVHSNLVGGLVARALGLPVLWSLHHSDLEPRTTKRGTLAAERLNGMLAGLVASRIVTTSAASVPLHVQHGYPVHRLIVVPNGVHVPAAPPSAAERLKWRRELGLPDAPLIGHVARWDPQKDHVTALLALGDVVKAVPEARLVLVGRGTGPDQDDVADLVTRTGMGERVHLVGERPDAADLVAAFDVCLSSSAYGETSSLALSEALARAVPVVTTRVGDAGELVDAGAVVVPPRDPAALAAALVSLLTEDEGTRRSRVHRGRDWVAANRSLDTMIDRYQEIYRQLVDLGDCDEQAQASDAC